ncbi:hypothetical protein [Fibrobacter sp. UBA3629]|uniref:hypothetical protein n=1 Tax=Fibrobacter sp. UBA3629 TaxID=1946530 RepID=UPI0025C1A60C|nr:hypothetical protein [Fibrobacter sp. UBA3629]
MSSKKVSSAKKPAAKAAPAKKPAPAKKAAPAKKPAPAKKAAPAKKPAPAKKAAPAKKPAPAKKAAPAKKPAPAKKAAPAKKPAPAKKVAPAKKPAPAKKAAPAKVAPAKKPAAPAKKAAPVKVAPAKKPAKPAAKPAPAKKPVAPAKPAPAKKPAPEKKPAPVEKPAPAKKPAKVESEEKDVAVKEVVNEPAKEPAKPAPVNDKKKLVPFALLLEGGKKLSKTIMFTEINEDAERVNQKKVSSELKQLEKKPTMAIRHKISLAEETQEELTERILKELEEQNLAFTREVATQICTRCNKNLVSPEFWVDKDLGYCEECAAILKLGQSKEARKVEYTLGSMGGDSLDEADDEDFGEGPDAADLKEAEEDLADFDEN